MSRGGRSSGPVTVPARVSVSDFAEAIGRPISEVQAVLESREEPSAPGDLIGPGQSGAVGKMLGVGITVEPRDLALETLYDMATIRLPSSRGLWPEGSHSITQSRLLPSIGAWPACP